MRVEGRLNGRVLSTQEMMGGASARLEGVEGLMWGGGGGTGTWLTRVMVLGRSR